MYKWSKFHDICYCIQADTELSLKRIFIEVKRSCTMQLLLHGACDSHAWGIVLVHNWRLLHSFLQDSRCKHLQFCFRCKKIARSICKNFTTFIMRDGWAGKNSVNILLLLRILATTITNEMEIQLVMPLYLGTVPGVVDFSLSVSLCLIGVSTLKNPASNTTFSVFLGGVFSISASDIKYN